MKLVPVMPIEPAKDDDERKANTEALRKVFSEVLIDAGYDPGSSMHGEDGAKCG
jgi:hypothetical protein